MVKIVIFRSAKEQGLFAFTVDTSGSNLPAEHAPWHELNPGTLPKAFRGIAQISPRANRDMLMAVQADGYCLACNRSTLNLLAKDLTVINSNAVDRDGVDNGVVQDSPGRATSA